jgi:DNA-binding NarL/FixJ family response regulator
MKTGTDDQRRRLWPLKKWKKSEELEELEKPEEVKKSTGSKGPKALKKSEEQKKRLKVFIMGDFEIFRAGLAHILEQKEEDFKLCGCEQYSGKMEKRCMTAAPDVILVHAPTRDADKYIEIAGKIKKAREGTRILAISESNDIGYLLTIAVSCCDGNVHSGISKSALVKTIENLGHLGKEIHIFDRATLVKMLPVKEEPQSANQVQFSARERQIVEMLRDGKNYIAIAQELELASGTVVNFITRMLRKYQFKKKAQLVNALPK